MAIFRCLVRGEGFPFKVDGEWKPMCFYATRFVEAASPEEAEVVALAKLRREQDLAREPSTPGLASAQLFFEKIEEVAAFSGPNKGFTFFEEEAS